MNNVIHWHHCPAIEWTEITVLASNHVDTQSPNQAMIDTKIQEIMLIVINSIKQMPYNSRTCAKYPDSGYQM